MDGLEQPKPSPRNFTARGLFNQKLEKIDREAQERLFGESKKQKRANKKLQGNELNVPTGSDMPIIDESSVLGESSSVDNVSSDDPLKVTTE